MTEFESIVIGGNAVPALITTVILMMAIPLIFVIYWRKNHKEETNISWLIAGAIGLIVSARVLELGVHYFCILADNPISRFINGSTMVYALYGAIMAGLFEECGRYIIMKFIMKKNRTPENSIYYGIGHGGIEILAVVLPTTLLYLIIALMFSSGDISTALSSLNITEESASAALPSVQAAANFDYMMMFMSVLERIIAMFMHIGLSVIVFYGVCNSKVVYLPLAILLHMAADMFAALYQKGAVPLWAVEVWAIFWVGVIMYIAVKIYHKIKHAVPGGLAGET